MKHIGYVEHDGKTNEELKEALTRPTRICGNIRATPHEAIIQELCGIGCATTENCAVVELPSLEKGVEPPIVEPPIDKVVVSVGKSFGWEKMKKSGVTTKCQGDWFRDGRL